MKIGKAYTLGYRRKVEGKTDYRARIKLLSSRMLRVVVRRMLNNITVQLVSFELKGDKTIVSSHTRELLKYGWKGHKGNLSSAYLAGYLCGLKAKKAGVSSGVSDFGLLSVIKGSSLFAVLKGLKDSGFDVKVSNEALPSDERIKGMHIQEYAKSLKGNKKYDLQFSKYIKSGLKPEEFSKHFEEVKNKITEKWKK